MTRSQWGPAIAFFIVALAMGYAIQRSSQADAQLLHSGLIAACERQNDSIRNSNVRTKITEEVLLSAAESRDAEATISDTPEGQRINKIVADRYRELAAQLPYAEPVDCEEEVPNP